MTSLITKEQLDEWANSPVTLALLDKLKEELDDTYKERSDMFIAGDALRTQEVRSNLIGQEAIYNDLIELLTLQNTELLDNYIIEEWITKAESTPLGIES